MSRLLRFLSAVSLVPVSAVVVTAQGPSSDEARLPVSGRVAGSMAVSGFSAGLASAPVSGIEKNVRPEAAGKSGEITNVSTAGRATNKPTAAASAATAGPRLDATRVGVTARTEAPAKPSLAPVAQGPRMGQSVAMMVVGGAALVTGVVIGGDGGTLVAIGGAVVGLVGLYHYIK